MSNETVYNTTGTAPIVVTPYGPGLVSLDFEDGSGHVYRLADLLAALDVGVWGDIGEVESLDVGEHWRGRVEGALVEVELWPGLTIELPADEVADLSPDELEECTGVARAEFVRVLRLRTAEGVES